MRGRAAAEAIIERHGHPVVLIKRDKDRPCVCRNELRQESTCDKCLGTGYQVKMSKAKAYRKKNSQGAMPDTRREQGAGAEDVRSYLFYLAGRVSVSSGDLIVERQAGEHIVHVISTTDEAQDGDDIVYTAIFTKRRNV